MAFTLFRFLRLFAVAVAAVLGILLMISAKFAFDDFLSQRLQSSYAYLESSMEEFLETARGARKVDKDNLQIDIEALASQPKIIAVTLEAGPLTSGWIQRSSFKIDPVMLSIPKDWIPKNPKEANLVVGLRWQPELVGEYSNGAQGYVDAGSYEVYDLKSGAMLFQGTVRGGEPPSRTKSQGTVYGSRADSQMVEKIREGLEWVKKEIAAG